MYRILLARAAERELARIDPPIRARILDRLEWLAKHVNEVEHKALKGEFADFYKLRIGDYRVFYQLDRATEHLVIEAVKHRREAYR